MTKDEFLALAEKESKIPDLYRSVLFPYMIVQAFANGHDFVIWNPYWQKVVVHPYWGEANTAFTFTKITPPKLYSQYTVDTQAR